MKLSEVSLLLEVLRHEEAQTDDQDAIRGLELRGLVERMGGGRVRYIDQRVPEAPKRRKDMMIDALSNDALTEEEAVKIAGDQKTLWLIMNDPCMVRLWSGDYAMIGGQVSGTSLQPEIAKVRDALPKGIPKRLYQLVASTGLPEEDVRLALESLTGTGEVSQVSHGAYIR